MIYHIKGVLISIDEGFLVIEVNGIGYKCLTDSYTLGILSSKVNEEIKLFTEMVVREDSISLFGFLEKGRLKLFKLLTSVSGVGSKVSLSILSEFTPDQLASFILSGNSLGLTKASGLGKKLAQRIVLELKDKIEAGAYSEGEIGTEKISLSNNISQALGALAMLGYSERDVIPILREINKNLTVEEMIRETLKAIK